MNQGFFRRRILNPVIALLTQGITPEKISLSLAIGIVLGMFPVIGSNTLLCALAAYLLGLNLPAIQAVNYLVYPIQLAMLLPLVRFGEFLCRAQSLHITAAQMMGIVHSNAKFPFHLLWSAGLHAIIAWLLIAPPLCAILYVVFVWLLRRISTTMQNKPAVAES